MNHAGTNFSMLMDLLNIPSKRLSVELNVDPSLVSRWRSGGRPLTDKGLWAGRLAHYFLSYKYNEVRKILESVCPLDMAAGTELEESLTKWLCKTSDSAAAQLVAERQGVKGKTYGLLEIDGIREAKRIFFEFLDYVLELRESGEVVFVCPDGLSLFTRDREYICSLHEKMMKAFLNGVRLKAVLRTDYRFSDVALVSGPWLSAHLQGFIQSYYYDDFHLMKESDVLLCLWNRMAVQITVGAEQICTRVFTDADNINKVQRCAKSCLAKARQRFHYDFFNAPQGFLSDVCLQRDKPFYIFQHLPHFGLLKVSETGRFFGLTEAEQVLLQQEYVPLFAGVGTWHRQAFYLLDADAVERALDQTRHSCRSLTQICGRRIYLSSKKLVQLLLRAQHKLEEDSQWNLLLLSEQQFDDIGMELGVWGSEAAIAWLRDGNAAAGKDYLNVSALNSYCTTVFQQAAADQSRHMTAAKLNQWIKRAKKMGLL